MTSPVKGLISRNGIQASLHSDVLQWIPSISGLPSLADLLFGGGGGGASWDPETLKSTQEPGLMSPFACELREAQRTTSSSAKMPYAQLHARPRRSQMQSALDVYMGSSRWTHSPCAAGQPCFRAMLQLEALLDSCLEKCPGYRPNLDLPSCRMTLIYAKTWSMNQTFSHGPYHAMGD